MHKDNIPTGRFKGFYKNEDNIKIKIKDVLVTYECIDSSDLVAFTSLIDGKEPDQCILWYRDINCLTAFIRGLKENKSWHIDYGQHYKHFGSQIKYIGKNGQFKYYSESNPNKHNFDKSKAPHANYFNLGKNL